MVFPNPLPGGHLGTFTVEGTVPVMPGTYYMSLQKPSYYHQFMQEYKYRQDDTDYQPPSCHQILKNIEAEYPDIIEMLVSQGMTNERAKQLVNRIIAITLDYSR